MTPLTPEQAEKLRLPEEYDLVLYGHCHDYYRWHVSMARFIPLKDGAPIVPTFGLAQLAELCANGHLPPEALDDVWRRVDGKPSREEELLRALVFELEQEDLAKCGTATEAVSAMARVRVATLAAREWIEEQSK